MITPVSASEFKFKLSSQDKWEFANFLASAAVCISIFAQETFITVAIYRTLFSKEFENLAEVSILTPGKKESEYAEVKVYTQFLMFLYAKSHMRYELAN